VTFSDVSSVEIELEELSWSNLIKLGLDVLSGNWMDAALDVIAGINLGLIFELSNNGLLPVYIPELSYDLSINDIPVLISLLIQEKQKNFKYYKIFKKIVFPLLLNLLLSQKE
jgi:hypothetical protein